jgi:hypothetical protein
VTADQPPPVTSPFDLRRQLFRRRSQFPVHRQVRSGCRNRQTPTTATCTSVTSTAAKPQMSPFDGRLCPIHRHSRPHLVPRYIEHPRCQSPLSQHCAVNNVLARRRYFKRGKGTACRSLSLVNFCCRSTHVSLSLQYLRHINVVVVLILGVVYSTSCFAIANGCVMFV